MHRYTVDSNSRDIKVEYSIQYIYKNIDSRYIQSSCSKALLLTFLNSLNPCFFHKLVDYSKQEHLYKIRSTLLFHY